MKLKKFAAAAVAMVMAVSMLSVPVWAASGSFTPEQQGAAVDTQTNTNLSTEGSTDGKSGTAATEVKLVYTNQADQLSVTVPISVTFAVKSNGDFICPSDGTYKIVNSSVVPVHVAGIKVTDLPNGYSFSTSSVASETTDKKVQLTLNYGESKTLNVTGNTSGETVAAGDWNINARESASKGTDFPINFTGAVSVPGIDTKWANSAEKICTITYTIAAGTAGTTTPNGN